MYKNARAKFLALWYSLPPKVQKAIIIGGSAAGTFLLHTASQYILNPAGACWTALCVRHLIVAAAGTGWAAGKFFYMRPGPGPNGANPNHAQQ
jgi:hypothetical protein